MVRDKSIAVWALTLLAGGLLLTACGPGQAGPAPSPGATQSSGQPVAGGTIRVRHYNDPYDWDLTATGKSTGNGEAMVLAYDSLLRFQTGPDVGYNDAILQPDLAEKWEVSPDARTFTFHLRKGVKFANLPPVNGRELTSADVKWSFEYQSHTGAFKDLKSAAQYAWLFNGLESVNTPDPYTAVVKFKDPSVPFLSYSAAAHNPVMPHEIYDKEGSLTNTIVGTGPFQLAPEATQKGSKVVFKKNPTYWQQGKPYLDEVDWLILPEDATATAALQTKQIDILGNMGGIRSANEVANAAPNAVKYETESAYPQDYFLRVTMPPLDDVRVRRAIGMSVDRQEFLNTFQGGRGSLMAAGVFAGYFTQDEIKQIWPYDPAGARKLLAEAGYPNGVDIELTYSTNYGDQYVAEIQLLQAQLRKTGINLELKVVDAAAYSQNRKAGKFMFNVLSGGDAKWDVDFPLTKYDAEAKSNYYGVDDPELTRLILAQRGETDPAKRREIVRQAGRMIADKGYGVGMYSFVEYYFWLPTVQGFAPNWNVPGYDLTSTWIQR